MRLFVGLDLSEEARAECARVIEVLGGRVGGARWVPAGNLHVTLKFLGECNEEELVYVKDSLLKAVRRLGGFRFELGDVGVFPNHRRPRILWVGVREGRGPTEKVFAAVDEALADRFEQEKRKFTPHITIARIKRPAVLEPGVLNVPVAPQPTLADRVVLFRSTLKPSGAEYSVVDTFPMNGGD